MDMKVGKTVFGVPSLGVIDNTKATDDVKKVVEDDKSQSDNRSDKAKTTDADRTGV